MVGQPIRLRTFPMASEVVVDGDVRSHNTFHDRARDILCTILLCITLQHVRNSRRSNAEHDVLTLCNITLLNWRGNPPNFERTRKTDA